VPGRSWQVVQPPGTGCELTQDTLLCPCCRFGPAYRTRRQLLSHFVSEHMKRNSGAGAFWYLRMCVYRRDPLCSVLPLTNTSIDQCTYAWKTIYGRMKDFDNWRRVIVRDDRPHLLLEQRISGTVAAQSRNTTVKWYRVVFRDRAWQNAVLIPDMARRFTLYLDTYVSAWTTPPRQPLFARLRNRMTSCLCLGRSRASLAHSGTNRQLAFHAAFLLAVGELTEVEGVGYGLKLLEVSHTCGHGECVAPFHAVLESKAANGSRYGYSTADECHRYWHIHWYGL
jgi:hypothetical protein